MTEGLGVNPGASWQQRATTWIQLLQNATSLRGILDELVTMLPWRIIGFYRIIEDENCVVLEKGKGYSNVLAEYSNFPIFPENNLISYCFTHRQAIRLGADVRFSSPELNAEAKDMMARLHVTAAMAIPLIDGGSVVGVIYIADDGGTSISEEAVSALESIAPIVASMIAKQQLLEIMENENQALLWMQEMSRVLLFVRNEEELWRQFRDMLIQLGHVTGGVYLVKDGPQWRTHDVFGILAAYRDRIGPDTIRWLTQRLKPGWETHPITWSAPGVRVMPSYVENESPRGRGLLYYIGDKDELFAVMTLYFAAPDKSMGRVLPALLQMFNLTYQIIRQRGKLEYHSTHDALTGLPNRRALEEFMEHYFQNPTPSHALLLLCDLDGFKTLNDSSGHQTGDVALRDVANYLQSTMGPKDMACRFGGDEFVVFLSDAQWDLPLIDVLKRAVAASPLDNYSLSVTLGVVELPSEANNFTDCYRLADERLYRGKRSGKNCVVGPSGKLTLVSGRIGTEFGGGLEGEHE